MNEVLGWHEFIDWPWRGKLMLLLLLLLLILASGYFGLLQDKLSALKRLDVKIAKINVQLNARQNLSTQQPENKTAFVFFSDIKQALMIIHKAAATNQIQLVAVKPEGDAVMLRLRANYFLLVKFLQQLFDNHYAWFVKSLLLSKKDGQLQAKMVIGVC